MSTEMMVKDTPLLMKGPLVCATLDDLKTQTRRLNGLDTINSAPDSWDYIGYIGNARHMFRRKPGSNPQTIKCPYGKPGDRLWVRETAYYYYLLGKKTAVAGYFADGFKPMYSIHIKCPSIHMPRWASRINLEITDLRVERVQEITETDLIGEGFDGYNGTWRDEERFHHLWDSINAKRGYPWKDNPWVWVVEFKRVTA